MKAIGLVVLASTLVVGAACAGSGRARVERDTDPESSVRRLVVTLSADQNAFATGRDVRVHTKVQNGGDQPLQLNLYGASSAVLFLEVRNGVGRTIHTIPPPMPPEEMEIVTLAPGESREFRHALNMFSPPLSKGRYTVRARSKNAETNVLRFRVLSSSD